MKLRSVSFVLLSFLILCYLAGGCAGDSILSKGYIDGQIMVVGNEPFTKLAVFDSTNNSYMLVCNVALRNELWKKQGSYLRIFFDSYKQDLDGIKLIVNHIENIK